MKKRLVENILFYLSGFAIVSLFLVIAFFVSSSNMDRSARNEVMINLENGTQRLEELENRLMMMNNIIIQNSLFNTLVYQNGTTSSNITALRSLNSLYRNLNIVADGISYIFTIFSSSGIFLSSADTSFDFEEYYPEFMSVTYEGKTMESAQDLISFFSRQFSSGSNHFRLDSISYISSNGLERLDNPVIVLQSASQFTSDPLFINAYLISQEDMARFILGDSLQSSAFIRITDSAKGTELLDTFPQDMDMDDWYIFENNSSNPYSILLAVPHSYFREQLGAITLFLFIIISAGILSGLVFASIYAMTHYKGVKSVISSFSGKDEKKSRLSGDFADIRRRIIALREEGESYREETNELARQNQAIQFQNILIQGIRSPEDLDLASKTVHFACQGYFVGIIRIVKDDGTWTAQKFYEHLSESLGANGIMIHSGSNDEVFIMPAIETDSWHEKVVKELEKLFASEENEVFHVGISQTSTEIEDLSRLYEEAERAVVSLYMYESESSYIFYEDEKRTSLLEIFNVEGLIRLRNLLLRSRESEAVSMLEGLFQRAEAFPLEAEERRNEIFYSLCNVYQSVFLALHIDDISVEKPHGSVKISETRDLFINVTHELCVRTERNRRSHNEDLKKKILDQIERDYPNPGLSAYTISRATGINEKYLLSFFRDQMGTSFSQYLLTQRLMKAKRLLETTDWSNERIASETGFGSLTTFYRNFSKYFGLSPKDYKDGLKARK